MEALGKLVLPSVFKTDVGGEKPPRRVRFPCASATASSSLRCNTYGAHGEGSQRSPVLTTWKATTVAVRGRLPSIVLPKRTTIRRAVVVVFATSVLLIPTSSAAQPPVPLPEKDALQQRARATLSSERALRPLKKGGDRYRIHLRFVVERGCEQTFALIATPEHLPTLFPRIKAFEVRRALDDGFLVDAQEGFIGLPLRYPVRTVLDEIDRSKRVLRIFSVDLDDATLSPTQTVDVRTTLRPLPLPGFCDVDFDAQTTLPAFVPDSAVVLTLGYTEDEVAFAIRDALLQRPPWPPAKRAPLLTPKAKRFARRPQPKVPQ